MIIRGLLPEITIGASGIVSIITLIGKMVGKMARTHTNTVGTLTQAQTAEIKTGKIELKCDTSE